MKLNKSELALKLQSLVKTVNEKSFLESNDKLYFIVNKTKLLSSTPDNLAKRSSVEGLEYMISLYTKYQL